MKKTRNVKALFEDMFLTEGRRVIYSHLLRLLHEAKGNSDIDIPPIDLKMDALFGVPVPPRCWTDVVLEMMGHIHELEKERKRIQKTALETVDTPSLEKLGVSAAPARIAAGRIGNAEERESSELATVKKKSVA